MDGWEVPVFAVLDVNSKVHMAGAGGLGPEEKESSVTAGRAISTATRIPVRKHIIQEPGSLASAGFGLGLSTHRIRAARTGRAGTREEARVLSESLAASMEFRHGRPSIRLWASGFTECRPSVLESSLKEVRDTQAFRLREVREVRASRHSETSLG
jgi:hypothetical protein